MSGRDPKAPIPEGFQCDYAPRGQRACSPAICDCFVADYPDDPFGLHPEEFIVGQPCGEHFGRHETNPHWVAVCTLPAGHDGDHDNVLPKTPSPDTEGGADRG